MSDETLKFHHSQRAANCRGCQGGISSYFVYMDRIETDKLENRSLRFIFGEESCHFKLAGHGREIQLL